MHNSCEKLSFLVVRLVNAKLSSERYWPGRRSQIVLKRRNTCLTQVVFRWVLAGAEISNRVKKEKHLFNTSLSSERYWRGRRSQIVLKRRNTCLTQVCLQRGTGGGGDLKSCRKGETLV